MDVAPLAPAQNFAKIREIAAAEAEQGSNLVIFPELSNTGYIEPLVPGGSFVSGVPFYPAALIDACADPAGEEIASLVALCGERNISIVAGLGLRDTVLKGMIRNSSLLIGPAGIIGRYDKVHQWQNEKLYFTSGKRIDAFETPAARLGMQICYDIRFPEITRILALNGAEIVTSVWASFGRDGQPVSDEALFIHRAYTRATENGVFFLSCNRSGTHGDFRFFGRSCAVGPDGTILGALDHDREDILRVEINLARIVAYRGFTGIMADRAPHVYVEALHHMNNEETE
jgi:predicted amidohydrolase